MSFLPQILLSSAYIMIRNNTNFANFEILGAPVLKPNQGQLWHTRADPQSTHTCQILSVSIYTVTLEAKKP